MQNFGLHLMLGEIWRVVADANRYFANEQPWIVRKTDEARFATILAVTLETIRCIAIMAQPVMPTAMAQMLDGFNGLARTEPCFSALCRRRQAGRSLIADAC